MHLKSIFLGVLFVFCCMATFSQSNEVLNLNVEARVDYQREYLDGKSHDANTGFKGRYLNFSLSGDISKNFSYAYRQRLNKAHADQSFFDATDWIYLSYKTGQWDLSAGKQVVGIGGHEYDRAPIDLYFCSEYWNNIPCYQLGVSVGYQIGQKDKLLAQICESPFRKNKTMNEANKASYAYNIMWYGSHEWFNTIYSFNMIEYAPGKYISYIALGNKFDMGNVALELDVMNRATDEHAFWGKNFSIMGELCWKAHKQLNIQGKVTYDVNKTNSAGDLCVMPGTEITRAGGAVEFFPLKKGSKDVRIHAAAAYTFGNNGNAFGTALDKQMMYELGLTWRMKVLSLKK